MPCRKAFVQLAALALLALLLSGCPEHPPATPPADQNAGAGADQNAVAEPDQNQENGQQPGPPVPVTPPTPSPAEVINSAIENCGKEPTGFKIDACLIDTAKQHNMGEPCRHLVSMHPDMCYADAAAYIGNAALCAEVQDTRRRENCYYSAAEKSLIAEDCAGLDTNASRMDSCYRNVAETLQNEGPCEYIADIANKDSCYQALATLKADSSICGELSTMHSTGEYNRDLCYLAFSLTEEICGRLLNPERMDECYDSVARSGNDAGLCRRVADGATKVGCLDYIARQLGSMVLCDEVADLNSTLGQACYDYLAENAQSLEACSKLGTYGERNDCYRDLAAAENSEAICAEILGDAGLRDDCYSEIGIAKSDSTICGMIRKNNFEVIDACYLSVGQANSDTSVCELIHFAANYIECFAEIAAAEGLRGVCATMQRYTFPEITYDPEQYCYKEYAVKMADSAYCEWVEPADLRAECIAEVS